MHAYELMVILDPTVEERSVGTQMEKLLKPVKDEGGSIENIDVWGIRQLAYEIQKHDTGIYVVVNMTTTHQVASEIDRKLGLNESVLRTKLLRTDKN